MDEEKKEVKEPKTVMLKPSNIAWLKKIAHEESTPENRVSDSAVVDRLIDEARAREESQTPSKQKKTARAVDIAFVTI